MAAPPAVGSKVTLMVQVELAATDVPQVLLSAKGAPVEIVTPCAAVERLVRVNDSAVLVASIPTAPKLYRVGVNVSGILPFPVRLIVRGLPAPL